MSTYIVHMRLGEKDVKGRFTTRSLKVLILRGSGIGVADWQEMIHGLETANFQINIEGYGFIHVRKAGWQDAWRRIITEV